MTWGATTVVCGGRRRGGQGAPPGRWPPAGERDVDRLSRQARLTTGFADLGQSRRQQSFDAQAQRVERAPAGGPLRRRRLWGVIEQPRDRSLPAGTGAA